MHKKINIFFLSVLESDIIHLLFFVCLFVFATIDSIDRLQSLSV